MLVINDTHIGFHRSGGTTPKSRSDLRTYLCDSMIALLEGSEENHLLIAGDLFDQFEVASNDWFFAYFLLSNWLSKGKSLTLMAGNHDWSPKGDRMSSFEMLGKVLTAGWPGSVTVIGIDQWERQGFEVMLSHCSSQAIFEAKLTEILEQTKTGDRIFLHANYDNKFAAQSDHSLNFPREYVTQFMDKGATLYFAHVHQAKTDFAGSVVLLGNQWPTSISDCLGNNQKFAHVFKGSVTKIKTWDMGSIRDGFLERPWNLLGAAQEDLGGFIRITGTATAAQASDVVNAIAKFRQASDAFVIANAVKVEGIAEAQDLPESFEAAKKFDVMSYIKEHLTPDEVKVVEEMMKDHQ